jgi:hypothetical protein
MTAKKIAAWQNKKACTDNILSVIEMFVRDKILGPLPQDPRPFWEDFRRASKATDDAYVALVKQGEMGASESLINALWDNYQTLGVVMFNALDAYDEAMGKRHVEELEP